MPGLQAPVSDYANSWNAMSEEDRASVWNVMDDTERAELKNYLERLNINKCPHCGYTGLIRASKLTTGGVICVLNGIVFSFVLIGIPLLIIGLNMRDRYWYCKNCERRS